jgi:hypothetical protein
MIQDDKLAGGFDGFQHFPTFVAQVMLMQPLLPIPAKRLSYVSLQTGTPSRLQALPSQAPAVRQPRAGSLPEFPAYKGTWLSRINTSLSRLNLGQTQFP